MNTQASFYFREGNKVTAISEDRARQLLDGRVRDIDRSLLSMRNNAYGQTAVDNGVIFWAPQKPE